MVKSFVNNLSVTKKISEISFEILNPQQIKQFSEIKVSNKSLYNQNDRKQSEYGVLDKRLGIANPWDECQTCGLMMKDCIGHFGYIDLALPTFHVGYLAQCHRIMQCICKKCYKILLSEKEQKDFKILHKVNHNCISYLAKKNLFKNLLIACRKVRQCPHCFTFNGLVKKISIFRMSQVAFSDSKSSQNLISSFCEYLKPLVEKQAEFEAYGLKRLNQIQKFQNIYNQIAIWDIFQKIDDHTLNFLAMNGLNPKDMILSRIVVPPVCIRPSVVSDFRPGTNEDDITMILADIIFLNDVIEKNIKSGVNINHLKNIWDVLQVKCAILFNSQVSGIPLHFQQQQQKGLRSYFQRLKGKQGRFRTNLSGKRVEFTARSVISPDPMLMIDQVSVPLHAAKILTFPEVVTKYNFEYLKKLIINGPDHHPGANFHESKNAKTKRYLKFADRQKLAKNLSVGDIVERHLSNGDIVLFNRQPSLHRLSIQAFKAIVLTPENQKKQNSKTDVSDRAHHRTLRFNECVCGPFNADFDGDEMNLHFPQTLEAQVEAYNIMGSLMNVTTPKNGEPLTAAIQDFITASYIITMKDHFFTKSKAEFLASSLIVISFNDLHLSKIKTSYSSKQKLNLGVPAIVHPIPLWTGKQIFSMIINPDQELLINKKLNDPCVNQWIFVNCKSKGKDYSGDDSLSLCSNDSYTMFSNGILVCGKADKSILGSGSKNNIFYKILKLYGKQQMVEALSRLTRLCSVFLSNFGFSLGIGDVTPSIKLIQLKNDLLKDGYTKCDEAMKKFNEGRLSAAPGSSIDETLESIMLKELSKIRESAGKACLKELPKTNAALIMALCGSKGSFINISQMISCIGQQAISGHRVSDGFDQRTLPHFDFNSKLPKAKGFVSNSFFSGQNATEFFFHTMAGREGLVDTAVKTATTGYMQRRISKCMEDLCVAYDGTVRDLATQSIIQFVYGEDGLDSQEMEGKDSSLLDLDELYTHISNVSSFDDESDDKLIKSKDEIENLVNLKFDKYDKFMFDDEIKTKIINFLSTKIALNLSLISCQHQLSNSIGLTHHKLNKFINKFCSKCFFSKIEPGTAVGAICSQAIGEPATQMTLKTFHFAGVASMNITQGVPRIQEIINAALNISTPIITIHLDDPKNEEDARVVKILLEKTTIGEISEYIEMIYLPNDCYLLLKISLNRIKILSLNNHINIYYVAQKIINSKLKVLPSQITILSDDILLIRPSTSSINLGLDLSNLINIIPSITLCGIPTINKSVIAQDEDHDNDSNCPKFKLLLDGVGLYEALRIPGVKSSKSISNNILEMENVLGIEATRELIIREMKFTMGSHGIQVDNRHLMLVADVMTVQGQVCGMTRHGLSKMKQSVFMLASFEKTCDHLFEAAFHGQRDVINGVSDSIIIGKQMKLGTGSFDILYNTNITKPCKDLKFEKRKTLRDMENLVIRELQV